jgi:hypothetical protein
MEENGKHQQLLAWVYHATGITGVWDGCTTTLLILFFFWCGWMDRWMDGGIVM